MLKQTLYNNALFDLYGSLLTQKQQDIYVCTYQQDLSLTEVAENNGISRSAVHDALKKSQALLERYEAELGCLKKEEQRNSYYRKLIALGRSDVDEIVGLLKDIDAE